MKPLGRCPWCGEEIRAIVVGSADIGVNRKFQKAIAISRD